MFTLIPVAAATLGGVLAAWRTPTPGLESDYDWGSKGGLTQVPGRDRLLRINIKPSCRITALYLPQK